MLTPEADVKAVEAPKPGSVIVILNPAPRIPTPRRVLGPGGRPAKTSSGSSSGYSKRVVDCHISISQIPSVRGPLFGGLKECARCDFAEW